MSDLGYLTAAWLGIVQGVTEFLPISSSGHLALLQRWVSLNPGSSEMLLFNVLVHLGTLLAVAIVFAAPAGRFVARLRRETRRGWTGRRHAWRIVMLAGIATAPTAAIGLGLQGTFEAAFNKPVWIGSGLLVTAGFLAALAKVSRGRRGWKDFHGWQALLVGIAQSFAILPGISRSGSTICVALFCGLRRRWAAEFSFLIAVPTILGAALLKLRDTIDLPTEELAAIHWPPLVVGGVFSLAVGVIALRLLLNAVRRGKLHYFSVYCGLLGAATLASSL